MVGLADGRHGHRAVVVDVVRQRGHVGGRGDEEGSDAEAGQINLLNVVLCSPLPKPEVRPDFDTLRSNIGDNKEGPKS